MIHEVDSALRTLIEREAAGTRDVEIVFDAPTREWAGRRNSPTIDVYLYDIREDMRRRERGVHNVYDQNNIVVSRHLPPRHFKLSYLVTAWTQRPEDEHRLLSSLLGCFLRYDALPDDVLTGPLAELGLPIPITIALPPPEDRAFADVWSALGGELKPSIDLVVITPLDTGQQFHTGPPVSIPPTIELGGSNGWPSRESKNALSGYQTASSWQASQGRLALAGSGTAAGEHPGGAAQSADPGHAGEDEPGHPEKASGGRRRSRAKAAGAAGETPDSAASAESAASAAAGRSGSAEGAAGGTNAWQVATSWADAMAPLGAASQPVEGDVKPPGSGAGQAPSPSGRSTGSGAGRPGPRVAMTRVRQTKKKQ